MNLTEFIAWRDSLDEDEQVIAREVAADMLFGEIFDGDARLFDIRDAIVQRVRRRLDAEAVGFGEQRRRYFEGVQRSVQARHAVGRQRQP